MRGDDSGVAMGSVLAFNGLHDILRLGCSHSLGVLHGVARDRFDSKPFENER